jgi:hypothetical protein
MLAALLGTPIETQTRSTGSHQIATLKKKV